MKKFFILLLLLMCFWTKIVSAIEPRDGDVVVPPPLGGGGPINPQPTGIIDPPINIPTAEPIPTSDDPGAGNKYMYHCKYHECTDPSNPVEGFLCSGAAADVEIGSCWREIVPDSVNARDYCYYSPNNWYTYNCFESSNLCQTFCDEWSDEPIPDDTEVVYCKPGCRTCEVYHNADGTNGTERFPIILTVTQIC